MQVKKKRNEEGFFEVNFSNTSSIPFRLNEQHPIRLKLNLTSQNDLGNEDKAEILSKNH